MDGNQQSENRDQEPVIEQAQEQPKGAAKIQVFDVIVGLNVVLFGAMWLFGGFKVDTQALIRFGAKFNYNIVTGEWWRLITPMFLHVDLMHLMMNTLGVISLSQPLKHIYGQGKLLAVYVTAGFTGVVLSFTFSDSLSAGASTAIFGMLGAHIYLYFRNREAYRYIFGSSFLTLIAINFAYGFMVPNIDNFGHLGGFIGGFVVAYALGLRHEPWLRRQAVALVLLVAIAGGGIFYGYNRYYESANYDYMHFFEAYEREDYEEAYRRLILGIERHPNDPLLKELAEAIK